jgi:ABC-type enterochelin transport system substrate-binding protein
LPGQIKSTNKPLISGLRQLLRASCDEAEHEYQEEPSSAAPAKQDTQEEAQNMMIDEEYSNKSSNHFGPQSHFAFLHDDS